MASDTKRLAVLIDAENATAALELLDQLFSDIATLGRPTVKRIYGDFTRPETAKWHDKLLEHSIRPVQQLRNTKTKNGSDIAMVIDAMDLLHSEKIDGFCIVSSDSDFTGLARRIREEGLTVYGFGEEAKAAKTSFVPACDRFIYLENIGKNRAETNGHPPEMIQDRKLVNLLKDAVRDAADDSEGGWAHLGQVGQLIYKRQPDFDPRQYDCNKLNEVIRATQQFDLKGHGNEAGNQPMYVRPKRNKK